VSELPLSPLPDAAGERELLLSSKAELGPDEVARCLTATGKPRAGRSERWASLLRYFGGEGPSIRRSWHVSHEATTRVRLRSRWYSAEYTGLISREETRRRCGGLLVSQGASDSASTAAGGLSPADFHVRCDDSLAR